MIGGSRKRKAEKYSALGYVFLYSSKQSYLGKTWCKTKSEVMLKHSECGYNLSSNCSLLEDYGINFPGNSFPIMSNILLNEECTFSSFVKLGGAAAAEN